MELLSLPRAHEGCPACPGPLWLLWLFSKAPSPSLVTKNHCALLLCTPTRRSPHTHFYTGQPLLFACLGGPQACLPKEGSAGHRYPSTTRAFNLERVFAALRVTAHPLRSGSLFPNRREWPAGSSHWVRNSWVGTTWLVTLPHLLELLTITQGPDQNSSYLTLPPGFHSLQPPRRGSGLS